MSDDNVVTFRGNEKEADTKEYVMVCPQCDNRTFDLYAGGKITCAFCNVEVVAADADTHRAWTDTIGKPREGDDIHSGRGTEVTDTRMTDVALARRFTLKHFNNWDKADTMVMAIGYNNEGRGQHWFDINSEEQRAWVLEKFDALRKHIESVEIDMPTRQQITPEAEGAK